ncbi:Titin [Merluccius polli]|uniref:Titin n=1 Tax=Merluccius polli TaxID=89951 RepID=A0AA47P026_MERPO|nr:Titin [Merluccius polli]
MTTMRVDKAFKEPVCFIKKLEDTSVIVGQPLKLVCTYTGSQRVHVTWKKDDKLIWASYQYNVLTTNSTCSLEVLYSDRPEASGKYSCEISNEAGRDVCHAHVTLGKGTSNNLPTAFHSSANLPKNYPHFLRWCMIILISLLTENNSNSLFNTGNMKQSLLQT